MKRIAIFLGLFVLLNQSLMGQSRTIISVDSLLQAALTIDEQGKILALEKEKISLDQKKLTSTFFPELNLNGIYNHQSEVAKLSLSDLPFPMGAIQAGVYDQYDFSMQLRTLLFDGFSRLHRRHLLDTSQKEQIYRHQYRKNEVKFQVYAQVYQYLYKVQSLMALNSSMSRLALQQQRVKALFDQGFASSIDTLDISSRMKEIQLQKITLQSSVRQTLHDLELLTGISPIDSITVAADLERFVLPEKKQVLAALNGNFDLQILNFQQQKLNLMKKQLTANYLPKMYFTFAYHYGKPGVNFFEDKWMDYWTVGVQFSWNLWRWGRDHASIRQQDYAIRQASFQQQLLQRATETKAKKFLEQLKELIEQRELLRSMISEKQEKFELIKQRWEQGQQTMLDVLQAEKELTETEMKKNLNRIQTKIISLMLNKETGFGLGRLSF